MAVTNDRQVILVPQYRPGPEVVLYELPGGAVEPTESPLEAARRELLEETGYTGDFFYAGQYYTDAYHDGIRSIFVAKNCHKVTEQTLDKGEHIEEVFLTPLEEFRANIRSLPMSDTAGAYLALDLLGEL